MKTTQTILVIEDDTLDVLTLKRAFQVHGVTNPISVVSSGEAAIDYLRTPHNPRPGLILLDLNMPRMNGLEFLQIIKADTALRSIPVIILTTSTYEEDKRHAYAYSVAGYIIKPIDYDHFVSIIGTVYAYWLICELPS
jgi:CheY-like chemotaxis protein